MPHATDRLPVIGITMGDPVGIGPEVIVKALCDTTIRSCCRPVVIGDRSILEREIRRFSAPVKLRPSTSVSKIPEHPGEIILIEQSQLDPHAVRYGEPAPETGRALGAYIIKAVAMAQAGVIDAVVTAPISKKSLHDAGYDYPGHTEMLAQLTGAQDVVMMLAGDRLRVVLVTIHCALAEVPKLLSAEKILTTIRITHASLKNYFSLAAPRLAVAGLNPHAGEGRLFGGEEQEIIAPALEAARREGIDAAGPFPPDTIFYYAAQGKYDAVVCMYHDQGLIPLKLLHFEDGVNITLGLPVIRTSVDHGTAYDIAAQGIASPASMLRAIRTAVQMTRARATALSR
jgi:4-hydroxythreonine-4-phosphate dehydrogenase